MSFFDRNRKELEKRGIDSARLPPGQYFTDRFPVLHAGSVPVYDDLSQWDMQLTGMVTQPVTLSWADVLALPTVEVTVDIHCVTKWSKFDTPSKGGAFDALAKLVEAAPAAARLMCHSEYGFPANLPLADVPGNDHKGPPKAMIAYEFDGQPLEPEHGYPLRFF